MRFILLSLIISMPYLGLYSQNVNEGLVGYWPMNCNLLDSTDNFNHGTDFGGLVCDPDGRLRESMKLDGIDDHISLPDEEALKYVSSNGFSWSIWFKAADITQTTETGISQVLMSFLDAELANDIYLGFGTPNTPKDRLAFVVDAPGGAGNSAQANNAIMSWKPQDGFESDKWYHACGIRDYENNQVMLYVDGIKVDSSFFFESAFTEPQPMQIGVFYDTLITDHYFEGSLDEVRIYDRVLTDREVLILATARPEQVIPDTNLADFGNIKCKADSTFIIELYNEGPSEFDISDIRLLKGEAFSINLSSTFTMLDQERVPLEITFDPPDQDEYFDTLYLDNTFGVQPLIIFMQGSKEVQIDVPDTLDFGDLYNCESQIQKDTLLRISNLNIDDTLLVSDLLINDGPFLVIPDEFKIAPNEFLDIEYSFQPTVLGDFLDSVTVQFENCDLEYQVYLKGRYLFPEATGPNVVDMGGSEIGVRTSTTFSFENTGTADLNYETHIKTGSEFTVTKLSPGDELLPGEELIFNVDYDPTGGITNDTLIIFTSGFCGTERDTILLNGIGKYRASFSLGLRPFDAKVGDDQTLILDLTDPQQLALAEIDSIDIQVSLNRSILVMNDNVQTSGEDGLYLQFPFTVVVDPEAGDQSFDLAELKVVLGNRSVDTLKLEVLDVYGQLASIDLAQNLFVVDELCGSGTTKRLFLADEWLELESVYPNPVNDKVNIDFSLIENGYTELYLVDTFGEKVKTFFGSELQTGKYSAVYSVSDLPSGTYFLILSTPNQLRTTRLIKY